MTASLRDDLDAAGTSRSRVQRTRAWTPTEAGSPRIPLDEPGALLPVQARMATSGDAFTLLAPWRNSVSRTTWSCSPRCSVDPADADQTGGASYAVVTEETGEVLVAVHHWVLPSISTEEFNALLRAFASAGEACGPT